MIFFVINYLNISLNRLSQKHKFESNAVYKTKERKSDLPWCCCWWYSDSDEWLFCLYLCSSANLAQIAFESVVSIVNSLHNSQELIRDQQGRNSLLATYLYWVFCLPDPPREVQNTGSGILVSKYFFCHTSCDYDSFNYYILCVCVQLQGVRWLLQRAVTAPWVGPQRSQWGICFSSPESAAAATPTSRLRTCLLKMLSSNSSSLPRYRELHETKSLCNSFSSVLETYFCCQKKL